MTPKQLREKGWQFIQTAQSEFQAGRYDNASYNARYAGEMALKARFCTRKGWADFPDDRKEAKRRGAPDVVTHDLDDLLKLSDSVQLKSNSMHAIDWGAISNWDVEERYTPIGTITRELAEARIRETQKLFIELAHFEIVEKLLAVEHILSDEFGPFNLFAFAERATQKEGWEVLMSAWWIPEDNTDTISSRIWSALDADLALAVRRCTYPHPSHPLTQAYHTLFQGEHQPRVLAVGNIMGGILLPASYVITSFRRPSPAAQETGALPTGTKV